MESIFSQNLLLVRYLGLLFVFSSIFSLTWAFRERLLTAYLEKEEEIIEIIKPKLDFLIIKEEPSFLIRAFLLILLIIFFLTFLNLDTFLRGVFYSFFYSFLFCAIVGFIVWKKDRDRRNKINEQLEDALVSMANTLKTVPTLIEAFQTASQNMAPPISEEFEFIIKQNQLGHTIEEALLNSAERIQSNDFELVVTALTISIRTGGNLPIMLEKIAHTLREIKRVEGLIESKTAEGKMQAWVMGLFPFLMMFAMWKMDPNTINPIFDTFTGHVILFAIFGLESIAIYLIIKITNIDI